MAGPAEFDVRKLDYEQTAAVVRMLTDVRFKLLALVPTVSALGVVIAEERSLGDAMAIATIGGLATVGLLLYELRNSQLYAAAMHRARALERSMGFATSNPARPLEPSDRELEWWKAGVFDERPQTLRLAMVLVKHDRALALIYATALTGWTYVWSSAFLPFARGAPLSTMRREASVEPPWLSPAIALLIGLLTWGLIVIFDRRGDERRPPASADDRVVDHEPPLLVSLLVRPGRKGADKIAVLHDANRPSCAVPFAPGSGGSQSVDGGAEVAAPGSET